LGFQSGGGRQESAIRNSDGVEGGGGEKREKREKKEKMKEQRDMQAVSCKTAWINTRGVIKKRGEERRGEERRGEERRGKVPAHSVPHVRVVTALRRASLGARNEGAGLRVKTPRHLTQCVRIASGSSYLSYVSVCVVGSVATTLHQCREAATLHAGFDTSRG
jgi:hypothetical protein